MEKKETRFFGNRKLFALAKLWFALEKETAYAFLALIII